MTPREIVQGEFECRVNPWLETLGFRYAASGFCYQRRVGEFEQRISISLSHRNSPARIRFWSAFNISSRKYNPWLKSQLRPPLRGYLGGSADWNIPGWNNHSGRCLHVDFSSPATRPEVLEEWRGRCEVAGIPYLNVSSWEGLAEDLLRCRWRHEQAADFFVIAGLPDRAVAALEEGLRLLEDQVFSWSEKSHPILIAKQQQRIQDRDVRRQSLEQRIRSLRSVICGQRENL